MEPIDLKKVLEYKVHENGGWVLVGLEPMEKDGLSFYHTIGLNKTYGHPEIITFGLSDEAARLILTNVIENIVLAGKIVATSCTYSDMNKQEPDICFLNVDADNKIKYFLAMEEYSDEQYNAIQMVYSDQNNVFPFQKDYDISSAPDQPILGAIDQQKLLASENDFYNNYMGA